MKRPTIQNYLKFRLGLQSDSGKELFQKLFSKPFYSKSIRDFWFYWNPFYTYFLTYFSYRPLKKLLPKSLSMIITFILCGYLLHDVVNMLISIPVSGFYIPFPRSGILFLLFGLSMVISDSIGITLRTINRKIIPLVHIANLLSVFTISFFVNNLLESLI